MLLFILSYIVFEKSITILKELLCYEDINHALLAISSRINVFFQRTTLDVFKGVQLSRPASSHFQKRVSGTTGNM